MFITALNMGASIKRTIAVFQSAMRYDLKVTLTTPLPFDRVASVARAAPEIARVEGWGQARASLIYADGTDGNEFTIMAPPPATDLLRLRIIAGRGLTAGDQNALMVNHIFMSEHPGLAVGSDVLLRIGGVKTPWKIVGVIRQIGPPTLFATNAYLSNLTGEKNLVKTLAVVTKVRSTTGHKKAAAELERAFHDAGIDVSETVSIYTIQQILEDHFVVLTMLLLFMSALIVIVGGLALITTMSIQVIERTREIGVMRSIGASVHRLFIMIGTEALVVAVASWLVAVLLALPLSKYIGDIFGLIFLRTTLDFAISPLASLLWLGIAILFSLAASYFPARKAATLTIREALAYE
jgi:putative ABC transport system permease protein